jgi:hypothetical protein
MSGGEYSNALQAASLMGHEVVVELLPEKGLTSMPRRRVRQCAAGGFIYRARVSG